MHFGNRIKTIYLLFLLAIISSVLHNFIYAIFKIEEPVFFILSLVLFLSFFLLVIFNTITYLKKREPQDIWKLGFLGLFGLIGLISNFKGLYGFFGFFAFFSMKKKTN